MGFNSEFKGLNVQKKSDIYSKNRVLNELISWERLLYLL